MSLEADMKIGIIQTSAPVLSQSEKISLDKEPLKWQMTFPFTFLVVIQSHAKYHAATSLASNHVTGLIYLAIALLKESGIVFTAASVT